MSLLTNRGGDCREEAPHAARFHSSMVSRSVSEHIPFESIYRVTGELLHLVNRNSGAGAQAMERTPRLTAGRRDRRAPPRHRGERQLEPRPMASDRPVLDRSDRPRRQPDQRCIPAAGPRPPAPSVHGASCSLAGVGCPRRERYRLTLLFPAPATAPWWRPGMRQTYIAEPSSGHVVFAGIR